MLEEEITETAITERASPIIFVTRKDVPLTFCVDWHSVSRVLLRHPHGFVRIDECIASLAIIQVFTARFDNFEILHKQMNKCKTFEMESTGHHGLFDLREYFFSPKRHRQALGNNRCQFIDRKLEASRPVLCRHSGLFKNFNNHMVSLGLLLTPPWKPGVTLKTMMFMFLTERLDYFRHVR